MALRLWMKIDRQGLISELIVARSLHRIGHSSVAQPLQPLKQVAMPKCKIGLQQEWSTIQTQRRVLVALGQSKKRGQIRAIGHNDEAKHGKNAGDGDTRIFHPLGRSIHRSGTSTQHNRETGTFIWNI